MPKKQSILLTGVLVSPPTKFTIAVLIKDVRES
jgi:hypothetical protein